ncbi:putative helicase [Vibrio phage CP-T1]|uniref:Putative helicase n=1 Tax=Vibrio phage Rostov M3 TaxID=2660724 RepID=A0A5Q2WBA1_9CAUD|nr:putative helicase [Vibrio phage CP-T1]AFC22392.1 putative helicase [Vibrio phage CP-T1]AIA08755.1 putative helicase [Vibrio phage 24]QGH75022.1 putative helicase [Vibrio phage Rostov M3]
MTQHPIATHLATSIRQATQPALRDYQQDGYDKIQSLWGAGYRNVLAVYPTGSGKTVLLSRIVFDHRGASCVIAHRQELVSQISIALARNGVRHRIIGPENVIRNIVQLHMFEIGMSFYDPNAQCAVAGVDTLVRRMGTGDDGDEYYYKDKLNQLWYYPPREYGQWFSPSKIDKLPEGERAQRVKPKDIDPQIAKWSPNVSLWVTDECFPAGTLIDGKTIETISVGDTVTAFNEVTHAFEQRKVTSLFKNKAPEEMVRIETKAHHVLNCTKGHPFWTKRGWIDAAELTLDDEVLIYEMHPMLHCDISDDRRPTVPFTKNGENILFKKMRVSAPARESNVSEKQTCTDELQHLRGTGEPKQIINGTIQKDGSPLLFKGVFKYLPFTTIIGNNVQNQPQVCIGTNERTQSDAKRGITGENASNPDRNGSSTENTRWERSGTDESRNEIIRAVRSHGIFTTGNSENWRLPTQVGLSSSLQNRLWKRVVDDSDRSRWELASINIPSGTGCKKRESSQYVGLESISILKSRGLKQSSECSFDGYVYNIEVEGLHTYVANGVVVHNCHHVLRDNKWGKAITLFPNAKGLGVTATPERSDGAGLGRHADGVFDEMVVGPTMRDLIKRGYLTDYDIVVPPNNITLHDSDISKTTGDYKPQAIADAVEHSSLVGDDDGKRKVIGDIVTCYEKFAAGKLGVTFVPSIKIGEKVKAQFIAEGIPAELVTAETPDIERARILRKFKNRELMNLINVDLFGEGFDLPAIEVVSMARPTQSYGLYIQQFGRALRLMEGKKKALIIDHVGNVLGPRGHGLPDTPRQWTLDRRDKRSTTGVSDAITLRRCSNVDCFKAYERYMTVCPHCGTPIPEPIARNEPEFVDGDLLMLDSATLARLRGEVEQVDRPTQEIAEEYHAELQKRKCPQQYILGHVRKEVAKHEARKEAQNSMRDTFTVWAGYRRAEGRTDSEIYRQFYIMFGIDYMTAMTVDEARAIDLTCKMLDTLTS